jgi:hypothetical protein
MFYIETDNGDNYINSTQIETIFIARHTPDEPTAPYLWRVFIKIRSEKSCSFLYVECDSQEKAKDAARQLIGQIQRAPLDMLKIQIHEIMDTIGDAGIFAGIPPFDGTAH